MALFREYDIRGIVGQELTEDTAERIGRAFATVASDKGTKTVTVGRDGRESSPVLRDRLIRGLTAGGLNVIDIGIVPTPVLYFSLFHLKADGGVMITGSHNAAEYNGFKLCMGKEALHGEEIQHLKKVMDSGKFSTGSGTVTERPLLGEYLTYLKQSFASVKGQSLHVVIDCGNGAAGLVAQQAMEQLGCRVTGLFCEVDGRFPNHHPDPTVMENLEDLIRTVKETGADVIGLDWRIPLDEGWSRLDHATAVQGNLDPVLLFAEWNELKSRAQNILENAAARPGHIFNLGHGILPETPVENVKALAHFVQEYSAGSGSRSIPSASRKPKNGSRTS